MPLFKMPPPFFTGAHPFKKDSASPIWFLGNSFFQKQLKGHFLCEGFPNGYPAIVTPIPPLWSQSALCKPNIAQLRLQNPGVFIYLSSTFFHSHEQWTLD